ncbi:sulfatase-like hydrolase/transferase [Porticoccaceae bacterium]|nr:sulfatase-like hydrolase/transferase [Porticoccaceae bacterium]
MDHKTLAAGIAAVLLVALNTSAAESEIAPNHPIEWQKGPHVAAPLSERPPNIVFILADDLGINDISTFGGGVADGAAPTPNIDRLAKQGATFTQSYAGNATCAPSRAMLMTGRYSTRTGYEYTPTRPNFGRLVAKWGNEMDNNLPEYSYDAEVDATKPHYDDMGLDPSEVTIAELLKQRGYHNVHIGKWHLGNENGSHPADQGFDESLLMDDLLHLPEDSPNVVNAKLEFDPIDKTLWAISKYATTYRTSADGPDKPRIKFKPGGYLADYWTDEALKVIEHNKNRPFFLYLAHWGPHTPLQATKQDFEAVGDIKPHRLRVYAAMIRSIDRSVGRVMQKLEEQGLTENTILVFSSDNGGAGYLGLPEVNWPYRGWKISFFEGGIRAPLFIKWPAKIEAETQVDTPVAHIDVMPTLAAAADAELPRDIIIDGKNLLPLAMGSGAITRKNDALFWQSGYLKVVRAKNWKLIYEGKRDKHWLFDLQADPTEQNNLAEKKPKKLKELKSILAEHNKSARKPLYPSTTNSPIMIDKTMAESYVEGDEFLWWPN